MPNDLSPNTTEESPIMSRERKLLSALRKNPTYYFSKFLKIETKAGTLDNFVPNEQQQFVIDLISCLKELEIPQRLVILKARQIGMSTLGAALLFHATSLWPHRHSKVIAHDLETTELLFEKSKLFYRQLPEDPLLRPQTERSDRKQIIFSPPVYSRLSVSTAGTKTAGSGSTVLHLHCSEVSKWENPGTVMTSLLQTVPKPSINPNTTVIIESTAEGYGGYYHEQYVGAKDGKTQLMEDLWNARKNRDEMLSIIQRFPRRIGWLPIFFPWFQFAEYREQIVDPQWFRSSLTPEELELKAKYGLDDEQLQFRRSAIEDLKKDERGVAPEELFKQEYPSNDEEAFIVTGNTFFDQEILRGMKPDPLLFRGNLIDLHMKKMMEGSPRDLTYDEWKEDHLDENGKVELEMTADPYGPLKIWHYPEEGESYAIGADVALGERETSDFSCIQVVNRRTGVQVANWWGRTHPETLAKIAIQLGGYYNEAVVAIENNSIGVNSIRVLQNSLYPFPYIRNQQNYKQISEAPTDEWGWNTNALTKGMVVTEMARYIRDRLTKFNDEGTIAESRIFRQDGKNFAAPEGYHDDRVMSMAIALWVVSEHPAEKPLRGDATPMADLKEMEESAEIHSEEYEEEPDAYAIN